MENKVNCIKTINTVHLLCEIRENWNSKDAMKPRMTEIIFDAFWQPKYFCDEQNIKRNIKMNEKVS